MLKLLLVLSIFFTEKVSNAAQTAQAASKGSTDSSPQKLNLQFRSVNGIIPYYSNAHQLSRSPQMLSGAGPELVKVSETPTKYPYAGVIGQVPVSSTYGNPVSTSLPTVPSSSQFKPPTVAKPTSTYGQGTGVALMPGITAGGGTQYGLGPLSESYNNFLGITSGYGGTTVGTASGGSTGSVSVTAGTTNPTVGFTGHVSKPELYLGSSRPSVNTGPSTVTGSVSLPQSYYTGYNGGYYQPQSVSENSGSHGSSGCPSYASRPGATCLQVGPQPGSSMTGSNTIQTSTIHPTNQVSYVLSNGTAFGYEGLSSTITTLGTGSSGTIVGTEAIHFNPQTTTSFSTTGSQSGSGGSSMSNLVSGSGGTSGVSGTGGISFIPQISSPTGSTASQSALSGSSVSSLGSGGTGTIGGTINFIPQTTPLSVTQSGSTSSYGNYQIGSLPSGGGILGTNINGGTGNTIGNPHVTVPGSGGTGLSGYNGLSSQLTPTVGTGGVNSGVGTNSASSGGVSSLVTTGPLQTNTQSQPYQAANNTVQTIVCVTPELCSGLVSQPAATGSGGTSVSGNGVLCTPSFCRPVPDPISGDYHVPGSVHGLKSSIDMNGSVAGDTKIVKDE